VNDNTVRVWDAVSGECVLGPLEGHTDLVSSVSISADGRRVVSGSYDKTVRVWDAVSGECVLGPLEGHTDSVISVSISADGRRVVSGSYDNTVRVWDAVSGECKCVIEGTSSMPNDIPVAATSAVRRGLSVVGAGIPAGIESNYAYVHGSFACAIAGKHLHFLRLQYK